MSSGQEEDATTEELRVFGHIPLQASHPVDLSVSPKTLLLVFDESRDEADATLIFRGELVRKVKEPESVECQGFEIQVAVNKTRPDVMFLKLKFQCKELITVAANLDECFFALKLGNRHGMFTVTGRTSHHHAIVIVNGYGEDLDASISHGS